MQTQTMTIRFVLATLVLTFIAPSLPAQVYTNVYRLVITGCVGEGRFSQSSFKVEGTSALMTALHGVSGCSSIIAFDFKGASAFAGRPFRISRVDIAHDVAELVSDPAIPADGGLIPSSAALVRREDLYVYGFPVGRVVSAETPLQVRDPPLTSLEEWTIPPAIEDALEKRGSPDPLVKEFADIFGMLMPGHSGAPLVDASDRVAAIADGGLDGGMQGVSWAVPWSQIHLVPYDTLDAEVKRQLGRPPAILFHYQLDDEPIPAVAIQSVSVGAHDSVSLGHAGYIPGLQGALNPILDNSNRTYLYASNVAVDGGKPQPVNFMLNSPLTLEDSDGNRFSFTVTAITSAGATVSYVKASSDDLHYIDQFLVHVSDDSGAGLAGASVEVKAADGTYKSATANGNGDARILHLKTALGLVTVTQPGFAVLSFASQDLNKPLSAKLSRIAGGGSVTLPGRAGNIPGLDGRLDPIVDGARTYIYATNIAVAGGQLQPTDFKVNMPFVVEDSRGKRFSLTISSLSDSSSTIQYVELPPYTADMVSSTQVTVTDAFNVPVVGADVAVVFSDGTEVSAKTGTQGVAHFNSVKRRFASLYAAHAGYSAVSLANQDMSQGARVMLRQDVARSSVIFLGETGNIPGLQGRLQINFKPGDMSLYADSIKINGGIAQPAHVVPGIPLQMQDGTGATFQVTVIAVSQSASLLEYKKTAP